MSIHREGSTVFEALKDVFDGALIVLRTATLDQEIGRCEVRWNEARRKDARPDILVNLKVDKLNVLGLQTRVEIPVLVEIEKGGIAAAEEDMRSLAKRPMVTTTAVVLGGNETVRVWQTKPRETQAKLLLHILQTQAGPGRRESSSLH